MVKLKGLKFCRHFHSIRNPRFLLMFSHLVLMEDELSSDNVETKQNLNKYIIFFSLFNLLGSKKKKKRNKNKKEVQMIYRYCINYKE